MPVLLTERRRESQKVSGFGQLGCPDRGYFLGDHERVLIKAMDQALDIVEHLVRKIRLAVLQ